MDLLLPTSTQVNKIIPKNKIFSKTLLSTKVKDDFTDGIQKITWRYKLSPETLGIIKTDSVEEIQIFELELKNKQIPQIAINTIDKLIPYPILYILTCGSEFAYVVGVKSELGRCYISDWNEEIKFDFHGINLGVVYENIVKRFIRQVDTTSGNFEETLEKDKRLNILMKEIGSLKKKIRSEQQFSKKLELNNMLQTKLQELKSLKISNS